VKADGWIVRVIPLEDTVLVTDIGTFSEAYPAIDDATAQAVCAEWGTQWVDGEGSRWIAQNVWAGGSLARAVCNVEATYDALRTLVETCPI
jgi:hypothetical protein